MFVLAAISSVIFAKKKTQLEHRYTWHALAVMKNPAACRDGTAFLANYGFMSINDGRTLQALFGGKLVKKLQKLFQG